MKNSSFELFRKEISKRIIGNDDIVEFLFYSMICSGHALITGVPGSAKTLLVKTIADVTGLDFNRIQFTPDLLPSDVTGTTIYNDDKKKFEFIKGPVFSNVVLADEINRTPPRTQSSLLQAMQEKEVTSNGITYKLPDPFFVFATQNPIEQEGTYPLPEAQLDRFLVSLYVKYPSFEEEVSIIGKNTDIPVDAVIKRDDIVSMQKDIIDMPETERILKFVANIVRKTRPETSDIETVKEYVRWGAGSRAGRHLLLVSMAKAYCDGRSTPYEDDVLYVLPYVFNHRIILNFKGEAEGISTFDIIEKIKEKI